MIASKEIISMAIKGEKEEEEHFPPKGTTSFKIGYIFYIQKKVTKNA